MTTLLKVGVIGVAGIANAHMPGWQASELAEVVAGADLNPQALQEWGQTYNITYLATDPADLFNDPEIDIIDICTPNMTHADLAVAALKAGKHVICEKPLAPTPNEIRKIIKARDESRKLLMTAQHFRFSGISQAMKREIDTGTLGQIYHARSWMLRRSAFIPNPTFIYKKFSGGGAGIDIGVHILDLTLWMMGNPKPITVSGIAQRELANKEGVFSIWRDNPTPSDIDVEEFAAAFVRFENGASLILEVSWLLHHNTNVEDMQMWLYGTEGGCHWPNGEFTQTNYQTRQHYNRTLQLTQDIMNPYALECVEFARAVAHGLPSPVPAEQALHVMTILQGLYRSQESGREVSLIG